MADLKGGLENPQNKQAQSWERLQKVHKDKLRMQISWRKKEEYIFKKKKRTLYSSVTTIASVYTSIEKRKYTNMEEE